MDLTIKTALRLAQLTQAAQQISDPRKSTRRKGRSGRMVKSNFGQWRRAKRGWVGWMEKFGRRKRKYESNVIPVGLRPWTPNGKALLASGEGMVIEMYWAALKAACTKSQFEHLRLVYEPFSA